MIIKKKLKTNYNKLSGQLKNAIKLYTEENWTRFLGKLGPYPTSTRKFWAKINEAKSQKKSKTIPTLKFENVLFKSDEDKANLFAKRLSETFTDDANSPDFDAQFYSFVEDFVKNYDFSDNDFPKVTLSELEEVIKSLKIGSSPGEDGIHNIFLKKRAP